MKKIFFSIFFFVLAFVCQAQRPVHVSGEYRYVVPETVSNYEAKKIAIERARLEAMAEKFGTYVSQTSTSTIKNVDGKSETGFFSVGGTESKGIWVEDTKEPEIEFITENNQFVVIARVWGKAREIKTVDTELSVAFLRNGIPDEQLEFVDNDKLTIRFKASAKGYVAIFLKDAVKTSYILLPYENENNEAREVNSNTEYIFCSTKDPLYPWPEETILTANKDLEYNVITVVFSRNPFTMPLSEMGEYVFELTEEKLTKWIDKCKMRDETMKEMNFTISIRKK